MTLCCVCVFAAMVSQNNDAHARKNILSYSSLLFPLRCQPRYNKNVKKSWTSLLLLFIILFVCERKNISKAFRLLNFIVLCTHNISLVTKLFLMHFHPFYVVSLFFISVSLASSLASLFITSGFICFDIQFLLLLRMQCDAKPWNLNSTKKHLPY